MTGERWHDVVGIDGVDEDDVIQVTAGGAVLALYLIGNTFYATDDCCTHEQASLANGYVQDDTIECPRHQGVFHIPTGRAIAPPVTVDLRVYPVRVEGDRVWVRV